jgi:hypothetical protein
VVVTTLMSHRGWLQSPQWYLKGFEGDVTQMLLLGVNGPYILFLTWSTTNLDLFLEIIFKAKVLNLGNLEKNYLISVKKIWSFMCCHQMKE